MKLLGNAATIPGGSRTGIPLPTAPLSRPGTDIASRVAAVRSFTSPIVMHETREFTRDQLVRAGYQMQGERRKRRHVPREVDPAIGRRRAEVARMYGEGMVIRAIAEHFQVSVATISNDLDAAQVERTRGKGRRGTLVGVPDQTIVDLHNEGLSCKAIGERLGSSESAVSRRLRAAGVRTTRAGAA